jgi:hypothetical protein
MKALGPHAPDFDLGRAQEYFNSRVNKTETCWLWTGTVGAGGYGQASIGPRKGRHLYRAHRLSFFLFHGRWPEKDGLMHSCDTPLCVNPLHLTDDTAAANFHDALQKGRANPVKRGDQRGERHHLSRLKPADVLAIREAAAGGVSHGVIGHRFGISREHARDIISRKKWGHL